MKINSFFFRRMISIFVVFSILLSGVSCEADVEEVKKIEEIKVAWLDTDGTMIESKSVPKDYDPQKRALPPDSNEWHYTGWSISKSGEVVVYTAKRIAKKHVVWENANGDVLNEIYISDLEEIPSEYFRMPDSNDKWTYEHWIKNVEDDEIVYTAKREANTDFFVGNVFQIIIKDKKGNLEGAGSGFVVNDEGWFLTNNHVMDGAFSATAYFDIKDEENGELYTQLEIVGGIYLNEKKDYFIGKIGGYEKIKDYYNKIDFNENYVVGESSYSVGYPNVSTEMEINQGKILEDYSNIYDKLDGVRYIQTDSYIAPGSSGGVLVNDNFEVIGITTIGIYYGSIHISGGAIPYFLFKQKLEQLNESDLRPLSEMYKQ